MILHKKDFMNNKKILIVSILIFVLLIVSGFLLFLRNSDPAQTNETTSNSQSNDAKFFSAEQVAEHSTQNNCWTIIDDGVYDITSYLPRHPGGDEIQRACGANGTSLFKTRTTDEGEKIGTGTPHSSTASNQLKSFRVGNLIVN